MSTLDVILIKYYETRGRVSKLEHALAIANAKLHAAQNELDAAIIDRLAKENTRDPYDGLGHHSLCEWIRSKGTLPCNCEGNLEERSLNEDQNN